MWNMYIKQNNKRNKYKVKNKRAQATSESILLLVLLLAFAQFVFRTIRSDIVTQLVQAPSSYLKGMARSGVWASFNANEDIVKHPNGGEGFVMNKGQRSQ